MFDRLRFNLRLLKEYVKIHLKNMIEYKIDFIVFISLEILYLVLSYFFIDFFVKAIPNIGLTTLEFYFYSQLLDCIFMFFLNYPSFYYLIPSGQMDVHLIKPVNVIYHLFLRYLGIKGIVGSLLKSIFLTILGVYIGINPIATLIIIGFGIICSTILFQSIYYLTTSLEFIKLEMGRFVFDVLNERQLRQFANKFPIYFFPRIVLAYMSFMPAYYVANLGLNLIKTNVYAIISLLLIELALGIFFFYLAQLAWKHTLKKYEGFGG